jgi:hypothetical protein
MGGAGTANSRVQREVFRLTESQHSSFTRSRCSIAYRESPVYCAKTTTDLLMSKTEGQTFRYRFGNETKTFWYRSQICLVENRLFRFGSRICSPGPNIEMISFDGAVWFHSCYMSERLRDVCSFTVLTLLRTMLLGRTEAPVRLGGKLPQQAEKSVLKLNVKQLFLTSARRYCSSLW